MLNPVPENLQELSEWLRQSESTVPAIHSGAEKMIVWSTPDSPSQEEFSVVYLHGYSASRQELYPLPEKLAEALGGNLYATRLNGHGLKEQGLEHLSLAGFQHDGEEAMEIGKRIGKRLVIIAASTGATLATWLAGTGRLPDDSILVFLSPNFGTRKLAGELFMFPWLRPVIQLFYAESHGFEPVNEIHGKYWTTHYPSSALIPMLELVRLTRKLQLEAVKNPLLILHSPNDQIVSIPKMQRAFEQFGSAQKSMVEVTDSADRNSHTLAGDILSPGSTETVLEKILTFIRQL